MGAIELPWRPGVKKVIIQLGDAPAHDPEPVTGLQAEDVIRAAFEVDPAEVYVIDAGGSGSALRAIAHETNGAAIDAGEPQEVSGALLEAMNLALSKPFAWAGGPYVAYSGEALTFDASGSYDSSSPIVSYDWDIDADGVYEATTEIPQYTYVYAGDFDGFVAVRVTSEAGGSALGSARVHVSADADDVPTPDDTCPGEHNPGQEDEDEDGVGT